MRADEALVEVHAAFLRFSGHQGVHLLAGCGVQVIDDVVVRVGAAAFLIEAEVDDVLAGLVLELDGDQLVAGIHVVRSLALGHSGVHERAVVRVVLDLAFPGGGILPVLQGDLIVRSQYAQGLAGFRAVREDHEQLHLGARLADDVDVLLIVCLVGGLVLPALLHDALPLVAAGGVDVHLVDHGAGLVLDAQAQGLISLFGLRGRFGLGGGRLGSCRSFRGHGCGSLRGSGRFTGRRAAGDGREGHQQRKCEGK